MSTTVPVAEPRPSASVILVRDGLAGLETFMVRRHARSPVAPSAFVFPGGTVRDDDLRVASDQPAVLADRSDTPVSADQSRAFYVCAIRELFEEAGVLLVRDASGQLLHVAAQDVAFQERLESTRLALQAHELAIDQVLAEHQWQPAFDWLVPFSHWITPRLIVARFDTRFFVAELPRGQSALHDTIETSEGVWLTPTQALHPTYHTVYATAQHLRRLTSYGSVAELLSFAREKPIRMVSPDLEEGPEGIRAQIPEHLADQW